MTASKGTKPGPPFPPCPIERHEALLAELTTKIYPEMLVREDAYSALIEMEQGRGHRGETNGNH